MSESGVPAYITPQQMADESGLPAESIRKALRDHQMPFVRMGRGNSRGFYVRREAFKQWLLDKEQASERWKKGTIK